MNRIHNVEGGLCSDEPVEGHIVDCKIIFDCEALRAQALCLYAALTLEDSHLFKQRNPAHLFYVFAASEIKSSFPGTSEADSLLHTTYF